MMRRKILAARVFLPIIIVVIALITPATIISSSSTAPEYSPMNLPPQPTTRSVLLSENFSAPWEPCGTGYDAPPGWTVDGICVGESVPYLTHYWSQFNDAETGFDTSNSTPDAAGVWWSNGAGETVGAQQSEWLITPELNLARYNDCRLSFNAIYTMPSYGAGVDEHNYIKVSTDGGYNWDIIGDMIHDLSFELPGCAGGSAGAGWCWYECYLPGSAFPIDLSAYDDEPSVRIAFHVDYAGTGNRGIHCIDDVHVDAEYVPEYYQILDNGWNLVSFPVITDSSSLEKVLASIDGKWDYIMAYDALDPDHWKTNATFRPDQLNDLKMLNHKMSFWIRMTVPNVNMTIIGDFPSYVTIILHEGWNLVGYSSFTERSISDALAGTGYDRPVEGFDAANPYLVNQLPDSYMMKPGEGYWVHVPADAVWVVDW